MGNMPIYPTSLRTEGFPLVPQAGEKRIDRDKLKKSCADFESILISQLLKSMRQSVTTSGLMGGGLGKDMYFSLVDQEVSQSLAKRGSLGLGKMIYDQVIQREERKWPTPSEADKAGKAGGGRTEIRTPSNPERGSVHGIFGR
jgi:Rod binding domain-containing protein